MLQQFVSERNFDGIVGALSNGADINAFYEDGRFPLYAAVEMGDADLVRFLLERGADARQLIRTPAGYSRSPLMISALEGHLELVELLLTKGAAVDQGDEDGALFSSLPP